MKNEIWFCDTETGGLDPNKHSILSLALVHWVDGRLENAQNWWIDEGDFIVTRSAMKINQIDLRQTDSFWLTPKEICNDVKLFIYDNTIKENNGSFIKPILGGHNTPFDIGFIKRLFRLGGLEYSFHYHYVDTLPVARYLKDTGKIQVEKTHLTSLCDYFGIKNQGEHTALGDALATAEVYTKMLQL